MEFIERSYTLSKNMCGWDRWWVKLWLKKSSIYLSLIFIWNNTESKGKVKFLRLLQPPMLEEVQEALRSWENRLWWVLHSLLMGRVLRVKLCPFWFCHWKTAHERSLLIQHLVQCFISESPQRCSEHTATMREGSHKCGIFSFFCDFEWDLVQNTCKLLFLWKCGITILNSFLPCFFTFLPCKYFVEYPLINLFHSAFFPQMFLK